jgi:YVTN family beta-propeller protein
MTKFAQKFSAQAFCAIGRLLTLALFLMLFGASMALAQTRAYVANINDNTVSVIDSATNTVIATVPVGQNPITGINAIAPKMINHKDTKALTFTFVPWCLCG